MRADLSPCKRKMHICTKGDSCPLVPPAAPEEVVFELIPQTLVHPVSALQIAVQRNDLPQ